MGLVQLRKVVGDPFHLNICDGCSIYLDFKRLTFNQPWRYKDSFAASVLLHRLEIQGRCCLYGQATYLPGGL